jgi:hemoglobin/transferrin/lactoferrin receptor protein
VELYFGSGSTLYGSDALGGVVYLKSRSLAFQEQAQVRANASARYSSAFGSMVYSSGLSYSQDRWSFLGQFSRSAFGDLRTGSSASYTDVPDFGLRPWYVTSVNGQDELVMNGNPARLAGSGYQQGDALAKLNYRAGRHVIGAMVSASTSSAIPRFDRLNQFSLTQAGEVKPKFAEWNYQPQNRMLKALSWRSFHSEAAARQGNEPIQQLTLALQNFEVGRYSRRFGADWGQTQLDKVSQLTLNYDRHAEWRAWKLQYGAEGVFNEVNSTAFQTQAWTGEQKSSHDTRYADSFANTLSAALYGQLNKMLSDRTLLQVGARLTHYQAHAAFTQNNFWGLDYGTADVKTTAPVFNIGLNHSFKENWHAKISANSALRNPNLDDLTKLFESQPGEKYIMPNTSLGNESSQTFDASVHGIQKGLWQLEAGVYHTRIKGLLIDQAVPPVGWNLPVMVVYRGLLTPVYQMTNAAQGWVNGAYASFKRVVFDGKSGFFRSLSVDAKVALTQGRYQRSDSAEWEPLDHIPPTYGSVGLKTRLPWGTLEYYVLFQGQKKAEDYSNSGEDNVSSTPDGTYNPSWMTHNLRWVTEMSPKWNCVVNLENMADLQYRTFASGVSAPGRNLSVMLQYLF